MNSASRDGGCIAQGQGAHAEGFGSSAMNEGARAQGDTCAATGYTSLAGGEGSICDGEASSAIGSGATVPGDFGAFAAGEGTTASGEAAASFGDGCTSSGDQGSFSFGDGCTASGDEGAFAGGDGATASGTNSFAYGDGAVASGPEAVAMNEGIANGFSSFACNYAWASGEAAHAENDGWAKGDYSHAQGGGSLALREAQDAIAAGWFSGIPNANRQGSAQACVLVLRGTTPGGGTNESVELIFGFSGTQQFILEDAKAYAFKVTAVIGGTQAGPTRVSRTIEIKFNARRDSGTTVITGAGSAQIYADGDASTSTWTLIATVGVAPDRIVLTFNTGAGAASACHVVAKTEFSEVYF